MRRRTLSALAGLAALAACRPTQLPGESLGQYRVTATLQENACGEGHPAPPSLVFHVELRAERAGSSQGYWKLPEGPLVAGSLSSAGVFRFEQRTQVVAIAEDAPNWVTGCAVERAEVVTGEIAPGVPSPGSADAGVSDAGTPNTPDAGAAVSGSFRGTTTVTVTPVPGGDCSPLLLPNGGSFPALPCQLRYELVGERLAQPLW